MNNELKFLIYNTPEEGVSVNAVIKDETIWLTQKSMAQLFDCSIDNISLHLKNIFADGEVDENSTIEEISVVQKEGTRNIKRNQKFYNLDAIISVGYRVNSRKATNFRIWATGILLDSKGKISKKLADQKAKSEYDEFNKTQKINSDFDKEIKKLLEKGGER